MNKTIILLSAMASLILTGCATFSANPHPGKLEQVGVLLVKNCQTDASCSSYSLLEPDLQQRLVALSGTIDDSLKGRLIAVLGTDAGKQNGLQLLSVEQIKAITDFDYQPFLSQAVADYTQQQYGCASFWDQSYAWRLDGRQPVLIASLNHPLDPDSGRLVLEFDGLNQALLSANSQPNDANPCQLK